MVEQISLEMTPAALADRLAIDQPARRSGKSLGLMAAAMVMLGAGSVPDLGYSGYRGLRSILDEVEPTPDPIPWPMLPFTHREPGPTGKPARDRSKAKAARKARRINRQRRK